MAGSPRDCAARAPTFSPGCTCGRGSGEVRVFRGWYVQASMELGPEDVSLLERCPHFRGWYVQTSIELGPEDVSLLERCPHFRGRYLSLLESCLNLSNDPLKCLCRQFVFLRNPPCTQSRAEQNVKQESSVLLGLEREMVFAFHNHQLTT